LIVTTVSPQSSPSSPYNTAAFGYHAVSTLLPVSRNSMTPAINWPPRKSTRLLRY